MADLAIPATGGSPLPIPSTGGSQETAEQQDARLFKETAGPLRQGLRAGMNSIGAATQALAGSTGEALGLTEFANQRFAEAEHDAAFADAVGPSIRSFRQVKDFSDAVDFVTGTIGSMIPSVVPAVAAGALLKRPVTGAILGTAPITIGHEAEILHKGPGTPAEKLGKAALAGTAEAAVMGMGPASAPVKAALGQTVKTSLKSSVTKNAAIGAGTSAGAAEISTLAHPEQPADLAEAAVAGGVGGAALGGAAHLAGMAPEVKAKIDARLKKPSPEAVKDSLSDREPPTNPDSMDVPEHISDDGVADWLRENHEKGMAGLTKAWEHLKSKAEFQEYKDFAQNPETRTAFADKLQGMWDDSNIKPKVDAMLGGIKKYSDELRAKNEAADTSKKSEQRTKLDEQILDNTMQHVPAEYARVMKPEDKISLAEHVKRLADLSDRNQDPDVPPALIHLLGAEGAERAINDARGMMNRGPLEFKKAIAKRMQDTEDRRLSLENEVRQNLRPELYADKASRDELAKTLTPRLMDYVQHGAKDEQGMVQDLFTAFGDKADEFSAKLDKMRVKATSDDAFQEAAKPAAKAAVLDPESTFVPEAEAEVTKQLHGDARLEKTYTREEKGPVLEALRKEYGRNVEFRAIKNRDGSFEIKPLEVPADESGFSEYDWSHHGKDSPPGIRENPKYNRSGLENGVLTVKTDTHPGGIKVNTQSLVMTMAKRYGKDSGLTGVNRIGDLFFRGISQILSDPKVDKETPFKNLRVTGDSWDIPDNLRIATVGEKIYRWKDIKQLQVKPGDFEKADIKKEMADIADARKERGLKPLDEGDLQRIATKRVEQAAQDKAEAKTIVDPLEDIERREPTQDLVEGKLETMKSQDKEGPRTSQEETGEELHPKLSEMKLGPKEMSEEDKSAVRAHVEQVLGKDAKVTFERMAHAGEFARLAGEEALKISVDVTDPMGVTFHETAHALFARLRDVDPKYASIIENVSSSPKLMARLRGLMKGHEQALEQLKTPEERAAYMYQFWASGDLEVGPKLEGFFDKVKANLKQLAAALAGDAAGPLDVAKVNALFEGMKRGDFAKRSEVAKILAEKFPERPWDNVAHALKPLGDVGKRLIYTAEGRLRDMKNPHITALADKFFSSAGSAAESGYLQTNLQERQRFMNEYFSGLGDQSTHAAALEALQAGKPGNETAQHTRALLDKLYKYQVDSGVKRVLPDGKMEDIGFLKDYFPRDPDADYISDHAEDFLAMLKKNGIPDEGAQEILTKWTRDVEANRPTEDDTHTGLTYFNPATQKRTLANIPDAEMAPFMKKDLPGIMGAYITRSVRRAEYTRRFGNTGEAIDEALKAAGLSKELEHDARVAITAMEGAVRPDMSKKMRTVFGGLMTYQNLRLLPLALFSNLVDPVGVVVRGGTISDAASTFKRGMIGILKENKDHGYDLAKTIGAIAVAHDENMMGQLYGMQFAGPFKKFNDLFFRYNGMESWNRNNRIGATVAAEHFIVRHAEGVNEHSERYLRELGLTKEDVKVDAEGHLDADDPKIRRALNLWVDGAIVRPTAAIRTPWMSDPMFMLVAHLKQFTYGFHKIILARVAHEAANGNYTPLLALTSYVPFMIAADMSRVAFTPSQGDDRVRSGWTTGDWLWSGMQRAGLFGIGQFGMEPFSKHPNMSYLGGPTVQQLHDFVVAADKTHEAAKAIPGYSIFGAGADGVVPSGED